MGYPGPPGWGLGVRLTTSPRKTITVTKPQEQPWMDGIEEAKAHPGL
jgi:hypothetical protein